MDNLTHSLVGWALADAAIASLRRRWTLAPVTAGIFRAVSIVAANVPDVDLMYYGLDRSRLAYLLHHRGHTHTVLAIILIWCLGAALFAWAQRQGRLKLPLWQWTALGLLAALSLASHLILDYGNNYGLHPFWPFDNHWYYGDSIFIVEPWLWVILGMGLYRHEASWRSKAILGLMAAGTILLPWLSSLATLTSAILLTAGVAAAAVIGWRLPQRPRLIAALAMLGLFLGLGKGLSLGIKKAVRGELAQAHGDWQIDEVMLTPRPANLLCWSLIVAVTDAEGRYRLLGGSFSLLANPSQRHTCQTLADHPASMPLAPTPLVTNDHSLITWDWSFMGNLKTLHEGLAQSCAVRAFGQFARAPFWSLQTGRLYLGDARFDRSGGQDFAEITVDEAAADACPRLGVPWLPPRPLLFPAAQ